MIITNRISSNNNTVDAKAFVAKAVKAANRAKAVKAKAEASRKAELKAYQAAVAGKKLAIGEVVRL